MKTRLFILLLIAAAFTCNAQTLKGTKMIGGSGSIYHEDGFNISLSPNLGYFIADNLAIGGNINLFLSDNDNNTAKGASLGPFVRYYFGQEAPTRIFAQANGSVGFSRYINTFNGREAKDTYNTNSFGAGVGIAHFLTEQVALEARLYYNNYRFYDSSPRHDQVGISFGVQIHLPGSTK